MSATILQFTPRTETAELREVTPAQTSYEQYEARKAAHDAEVEAAAAELRVKYPWAKAMSDSISSYARAAANIKQELKREFPGIKFSVKSKSYAGGNSVDVSWDLGPTTKQVDAVISKYAYGEFNGMEDIYEYDHSVMGDAVGKVLGQAKYVHSSRDYPNGMYEQVSRLLCEKQRVEYTGPYTTGVYGDNDCTDVQTYAYRIMNRTAFPAGATAANIVALNHNSENHDYDLEVA